MTRFADTNRNTVTAAQASCAVSDCANMSIIIKTDIALAVSVFAACIRIIIGKHICRFTAVNSFAPSPT